MSEMTSQGKIIKLYTSKNIHIVKENTRTFKNLENLLIKLLGQGPFYVSYKDDEGDMISIINDMELSEAYETCEQLILNLYVRQENDPTTIYQDIQHEITEVVKLEFNSQDSNEEVIKDNRFQIQNEEYEDSDEQNTQILNAAQPVKKKEVVEYVMQKAIEFSIQQLKEQNNDNIDQQRQKPETEQKAELQNQKAAKRIQKLQKLTEQKKDLKGTIKELQQKQQQELISDNMSKQEQAGILNSKGMIKGQQQNDQNEYFYEEFSDIDDDEEILDIEALEAHPKFMQNNQMIIEEHIRPEFIRMKNIILQELRNSQLQNPYETEVNLTIHDNAKCDGCYLYPIIGVRYKCSVCKDFDYCMQCEAEIPHPHAFLKIKNLSQEPKAIFVAIEDDMDDEQENQQSQQSDFNLENMVQQMSNSLPPTMLSIAQKKANLKAQIISHITYPNNSKVQPGQTILKTWQVKNIGIEPWPLNTKIYLVKGNINLDECSVPALIPGEVGYVSLKLVIPNLEGNFECHYKFITTNDQKFGKKLVLKVNSSNEAQQQNENENENVAQEENSKQKQIPVEEIQKQEGKCWQLHFHKTVQQSKLEEQIETVMQLGFNDREVIKSIILAHEGDLEQVINILLTQ